MSYDITADSPTDAELTYLEHAAPELATGHFDYCPTCGKTGRYAWKGQVWPCDCATQLALAQRYTLAGIAKKYWRLGWPDYRIPLDRDVVDYLEFIDAYIENGMGLILAGTHGVGKTMITTLILKELVKRGYSCYATTFATLADHIMSGWGKGDVARMAGTLFAERFEYSHVLLLDDLGKEFKASNSVTANTFDRVLRTRLQANRPVLLTTNYSVEQIVEGYGAAVFSMLREQSVPVAMVGADYRDQAQRRLRDQSRTGERPPIQ